METTISKQHQFIKNQPERPKVYTTDLEEVEIIDLAGRKRQGYHYAINAFTPAFGTIYERIIITNDSGNHEKHVRFTWDRTNQIYRELADI